MGKKASRPPRGSERLLETMANRGDSDSLAGDISEEFHRRVEDKGLFGARLWYRLFVLGCLPSFVRHFLLWNLTMGKNYLTIAARVMKRHKAFSSINIAGLGVGMACSIMIGLFVIHESGYDRFHANSDRIYRVYADIADNTGSWRGAWTPPPLAEALLGDFPEVEAAARYSPWPGESLITARGKSFLEKDIKFADASFFTIFSYPFIYGNPETALENPGTIVISRAVAEKYFGHDDPLGETVTFEDRQRDFTVTGVIENPPPKSHFQFDMVATLASSTSSTVTRWTQNTYFTYILLREGASATALEAKFPEFTRLHYGPQFFADTGTRYEDFYDKGDHHFGFRLESLTDIHLNKNVTDNLSFKGNTATLKLFSAVAFFLLLIASINFMNLATARSAHRSREVGIRKVLGSRKKQLVVQFLGESLLVSTIALVLSLGTIALVLPAFARLAQRPIALRDLGTGMFPFLLVGITLVVGLTAGSYPAIFLSSFTPQTTIRGRLAVRGKGQIFLRRALVLIQFAISFAVIFGTGVISSQMAFLRNRTLGFDKDNVVVIHRAAALGDSAGAFENELLAHSDILNVSRTESLPGRHFNPNGHRVEGAPATEERALMTIYVDERFADLLGLELSAGRFFCRDVPTDATTAVVINERAARELGLSDPLGKRLHKDYGGAKEGEFVTIIGVLKDFHFSSLHQEILPMLLRPLSPENWALTSVKVRGERLPRTLALIEKTWEKFTGSQPFQYSFLDQDFGALYDSERRTGKIFLAFSVLTILVACLGLYGLVSFAAEQRTREIGIRKTFGASVANLAGLLSREVIVLVGVSAVIASPPAFFIAEGWLRNFAYRTSIHPLMFVVTGTMVVSVAFLSVSFKAVRAAGANPVETLRYE